MTDVQVSERDRELALATGYAEGSRTYLVLVKAIAQARAEEREACASACLLKVSRPAGHRGQWEGYGGFDDDMTGPECAAAIRARGEK